jgi:hypothetical protein
MGTLHAPAPEELPLLRGHSIWGLSSPQTGSEAICLPDH